MIGKARTKVLPESLSSIFSIRQYVPSKCWYLPTGLHGFIAQKATILSALLGHPQIVCTLLRSFPSSIMLELMFSFLRIVMEHNFCDLCNSFILRQQLIPFATLTQNYFAKMRSFNSTVLTAKPKHFFNLHQV
jgi:hypothetical protein